MQPIYNLHTKSFTGAEALLRLKNEDGEYIPPMDYIPKAESDGDIVSIGRIVLRKTCEYISKGNLKNLGIEKVHINLSVVECMQDDIVKVIVDTLESYNVPRDFIRLEITETMLAADSEKLLHTMLDLSEHGIDFALDDYGTGDSNTSRMLSFPFSEIKFDKSLIDSMQNKEGNLLMKHLTSMIKDIDRLVLAEGVEIPADVELLKNMNCDLIQGFYFAKPMPREEFVKFLSTNRDLVI